MFCTSLLELSSYIVGRLADDYLDIFRAPTVNFVVFFLWLLKVNMPYFLVPLKASYLDILWGMSRSIQCYILFFIRSELRVSVINLLESKVT